MFKKKYVAAAVVAALSVPAVLAIAPAAAEKTDNLSPKEQLGMSLFFDTNLSEPAGQACASCHDPDRAFAHPDKDNIAARGASPHLVGNRNVPAILYAKHSPAFHFNEEEGLYLGGQFLDGRAASLEEQAKGPFLNPLEMANPDKKAVVEKVRRTSYAPMFDAVFGAGALHDTEQAYERIAEALAAFQRTERFSPFTSKYDAWLAGKARLSDQELRGLRLFEAEDKGNCAACHPSRPGPEGEPPLFTDFSYDNLGVPRNPDNPFYKAHPRVNPAGEHFVDRGLGAVVGMREEDGKFKVPTLRNIELTAPYMHNGYFKTLRGAVAFYNDRDVRPLCGKNLVTEAEALKQKCWPAPEVIANVNREELGNLKLTEREIDDIVAFLKTLNDGYRLPGAQPDRAMP